MKAAKPTKQGKFMSNCTDVDAMMSELGAGLLKAKLGVLLSDVALGTVLHGIGNNKGKLSLEFTFSRVGDNDQVIITHKISHSTPTGRGKRGEEYVTQTPFFVGKGGKLTIDAPREEEGGQFTLSRITDGK